MANYGKRFAADTYGCNAVKLNINKCEESSFIWCPAYVTKVTKETTIAVSKVLRFNKGGVMVRA